MGCSVQGVGFRHRARVSLGFSVWDVGFRVWALGSGSRCSTPSVRISKSQCIPQSLTLNPLLSQVVWDNVRCLKDGECVSVDGTHLGHNLPDRSGNRYCINLVSVAGTPQA